ncbi:hypothetical protein DENSPDRAFT_549085 [Dentipellis sp. KUC8613]|nr:hypothetical protein DENSPDRAFT_549085 [Dentipellis sp. KUC8613]
MILQDAGASSHSSFETSQASDKKRGVVQLAVVQNELHCTRAPHGDISTPGRAPKRVHRLGPAWISPLPARRFPVYSRIDGTGHGGVLEGLLSLGRSCRSRPTMCTIPESVWQAACSHAFRSRDSTAYRGKCNKVMPNASGVTLSNSRQLYGFK